LYSQNIKIDGVENPSFDDMLLFGLYNIEIKNFTFDTAYEPTYQPSFEEQFTLKAPIRISILSIASLILLIFYFEPFCYLIAPGLWPGCQSFCEKAESDLAREASL